MTKSNSLEMFQQEFADKYGKGTVVETNITAIIQPSQVVTLFYEGFTGRLSVLDISWCLPEGEEKFRFYKIGERIKCVVTAIDFKNKQVLLSQKHLAQPLSDTITWERIERGDEFQANVVEELNDNFLLKTSRGQYGLLHKSFLKSSVNNLKVKVNTKLDYPNLLSFVPTSLEMAREAMIPEQQIDRFSFIEEDLQSFYKFKRSMLAVNASDEECEVLKRGFDSSDRIFSKEISTSHPLYIQFELASPAYESTLKQHAIPYFYDGTLHNDEKEKDLLGRLSREGYWFRINKRFEDKRNNNDAGKEINEFSLFNEKILFWGEVKISKDKKEYVFLIRNFSFSHNNAITSKAKKWNAKNGSFLFSNRLIILSPFDSLPIGDSQKTFLEFVQLKTRCFEIVNRLKGEASEILRQEGRTLGIIDKFLEYQASLIDDKKENAFLVDKFERMPGQSGALSIKLPLAVANSLELEDETVVNIRLKKADELVSFSSGVLSYYQDGCKITFYKEVNLSMLADGFYVDKKISKRQLLIQSEIIQDFLQKKIKIDHIESLLVNPDTIKTPALAEVVFKNPDLERTQTEQPDNNQVRAVRKAISNQNIFLIQGPPGTGKTTVIAEIIEQLVARGEKILVAGQNHVAVDNVLEKIAKLHHLNLLRVGNPERIDPDLVQFYIENLIENHKLDYNLFVKNQVALAKKYLQLITFGSGKDSIFESFRLAVNDLSSQYRKLGDVYKHRHFTLREGLGQLKSSEIEQAVLALEKWMESCINEYEILLRPLIYNSIDVVFATCIGIKTDAVFRNTNFRFDTVIIDEAGKANIAETLVAIELGKKVILVGDQKQLPPYMDSSLIDEKEPGSFPKSSYGADYTQDEIVHALKASFFEFIVNRMNAGRFPMENKEMLNYQHRMHPHIGKFVSESFYDGLVQMGGRTHYNKLELPTPFNKEIVFFDTSNSPNPYEQNDGYSAKNNTEAECIAEMIMPPLLENNISPDSIAIIAPYKSQVANIQNHIRNSSLRSFTNIDVSTLDSFQGKEYDIIIFSFTRSSNFQSPEYINGKRKSTKVGFLDDARRLNVAFSRAKKKLVLVGNATTLTDSRSHYDGLYDYTKLFRTLVALSRRSDIGNFVNIADVKSSNTFREFISKYKPGAIVYGIVGEIALSARTQKKFGRFIIIDGIKVLAPYFHRDVVLNRAFERYVSGQKIIVRIIDIVPDSKKVNVEILDVGTYRIFRDLEVSQVVQAEVINIYAYSYLLKTASGLKGILPAANAPRNKRYKIGDKCEVKVVSIELNEFKVTFKTV